VDRARERRRHRGGRRRADARAGRQQPLSRERPQQFGAVARALGYRPATFWFKSVLPQVYGQLRLPVYAVLAYSLSAVDIAIVLAPNTPAPLSPTIVRWFTDRDLSLYFPAAAGACLQLVVAVVAIGAWRIGEIAAWALARRWIERGGRGHRYVAPVAATAIGGGVAAANLLAILVLAMWSLAAGWRFPDVLPSGWTAATWTARAGSSPPRCASTPRAWARVTRQ